MSGRRLLLLLSAALPLAVLPAAPALAQDQSAGVSVLLGQADYWLERGRGDLARQAFQRVLEIDPDNEEALQGLAENTPGAAAASTGFALPTISDPSGQERADGFEELNAGNVAEAQRHFERALGTNAEDAEAIGGMGLVRLRQGRFAEARDLLTQASRLGSAAQWRDALASARYYADLRQARNAFDAGRLDQASRLTDALLRSGFSDRSEAELLSAQILEAQGRFDEAAEMSRQAARDGAMSAPAAARLQSNAARQAALSAAASGDLSQAEQRFLQGIAADSTDPWIRYEYARFLLQQGRQLDSQLAVAELANQSDPESLYAASLFNREIGQPDAALALIDRIPAAERTAEMRALALGLNADAAVERARALAASGGGAQALAALQQIAATEGLPAESRARIAQAMYDLGDAAGASAIAQLILNDGLPDAAAYEPLVRIFAQTGQSAFAMSALQKAQAQAGESAEGRAAMARLNAAYAVAQADQMRLAGQYAPAFDLLQARWAESPGNIEILGALARLYQSGGLYPQAAQTYQMVLGQTPDDRGALLGMMQSATAAGQFDLAEYGFARARQAYPQDYEFYMAAADMERARGKERQAKRYLEAARDLYLAQTRAAGAFGGGNPFAPGGMAANPFAASAPAAVNPFTLATSPQPVAAPVPIAAYAAPQAYAPTAYAQPAPQPAYSAQAASPAIGFPQPAVQAQATPFQILSPAQPAAPRPMGLAQAGPVATGDPVLDRITANMEELSATSGPLIAIETSYRERSGEAGLSGLQDIGGSAELSTDFAGGRVSVRADVAVLDSGRPEGSGLARFGRNPSPEAQAIVDEEPSPLVAADVQHASGIAPSVAFESDLVEADIGTSPLGFDAPDIVGGVSVNPRLGDSAQARIFAERRAVTDSVLSYAGATDPISGEFWGAVVRTGGGIGLSWERDGAGAYIDGAYYDYSGDTVASNSSVEMNLGGYMPVFVQDAHRVLMGVNANYQSYDNNQNFFTLGHGGYFSPQSFLSIGFPVRYSWTSQQLEVGASFTPGYQSYEQEASPIYPTDPAAQAVLDALKALNSDVRAAFDSESKTGVGVSAAAELFYRLTARTQVGGELRLNTFGDYDELSTRVAIRQRFGGE